MLDWRRLRHFVATIFGRVAAALRYNRVDFVTVDDVSFCRKRRLWFSRPLLFAGNLWLDRQREGVRILAFDAWRKREEQIWLRLYGQQVRIIEGELWFPMIPGEILDHWLSGPRTQTEQLQAIASASLALAALHALECAEGNESLSDTSHGDAAVNNVMYDATTNRATWFDFETLHDSAIPRVDRFADDLRALLCSSAGCLPNIAAPSLVDAVLANDRDTKVLAKLLEQLDRELCRPRSYHAAQSKIGLAKLLTLRDEVANWMQSHT